MMAVSQAPAPILSNASVGRDAEQQIGPKRDVLWTAVDWKADIRVLSIWEGQAESTP